MKHGFLILTHFPPEKILGQVKRLQSPQHYFFIHFDKKLLINENDASYKELAMADNVTILKNRTDVQWGGFSILTPILGLIREALKRTDIGYLHLISAECLHVKSIGYLHDFFNKNNGKEFIQYFLMTKKRQTHSFTYRRIDKYHLYEYYHFKSKKIRDRVIKGIDSIFRKLQRGLQLIGIYRRYSSSFPTLYAGATWWSLTYNACKYMIEYIDNNPAFYNRFKYTQLSDEILPHTLMLHSPYKDNVVNNNLRYTYFEEGSAHPNPLTLDYLPELSKEDILFARKFTPASAELLAYLDEHVYYTVIGLN